MALEGGVWSEVELPAGTPMLNWVFGFGPNDVLAVGESGVVLRFDGARFVREPTPTDEDLWGVWGSGPGEVWAVGGRGRAAGQATLLRRGQDGWAQVPLPDVERPGVNALFKVWGTAAADVIVVGQRGIILRYDGADWSEEGAGLSDDLISVWGSGRDHVVAVGGRGNGVAAVYDGRSWRRFTLAPEPGLNGVWTDEPETAWIVGEAGTVFVLDTATGSVRPAGPELDPEARQADFHAVFGGAGELVAVGGNFSRPRGPFRGIAFARPLGARP